jgi:hypothetical protein
MHYCQQPCLAFPNHFQARAVSENFLKIYWQFISTDGELLDRKKIYSSDWEFVRPMENYSTDWEFIRPIQNWFYRSKICSTHWKIIWQRELVDWLKTYLEYIRPIENLFNRLRIYWEFIRPAEKLFDRLRIYSTDREFTRPNENLL